MSGKKNQLTKQVGEYLVASELARKGNLSSTFAGNVPDIDIVSTNIKGKTKLVQVKTSNSDGWQLDLSSFVEMKMNGNKQILGREKEHPVAGLIYVFVKLGNKYGEDKFYIISWKILQKILIDGHKEYLLKNDGERPSNKESLHCLLKEKTISKYTKWDILL
jgi:hypothetical protein